MPEITKAQELLRDAHERQGIGAYEALNALLTEHAKDPEAMYEGGWRTVVWKEPDASSRDYVWSPKGSRGARRHVQQSSHRTS